ncbi:MAG: hypothetical protein LLG43_01445, partial [Deltaproteobacteria bacterium]|nr:hypothetical protein [Deltaproteobacteria bacterium]
YNNALGTADSSWYTFYDGDINLYPKLIVNNTTLNLKLAIHDQVWGEEAYTTTSTAPDVYYNLYSAEKDDNINIELAWVRHMFTENTILDLGLMDGQAWGTKFCDYTMPRWRVKFMQKTPVGLFGALLEKDAEQGSFYEKDAEKDDHDHYAIFAITKAGNVFIKPLLYFVNNSTLVGDLGSEGAKLQYYALELSGNLGIVDFESELGYKKFMFNGVSPFEEDAKVYGAYLNVWKAMDFGKPGITLAYGNWDKNSGLFGKVGGGYGFDFRNDFKSNLILGGRGLNNENVISATLGETRGFLPIAAAAALNPALAPLAAAAPGTYVDAASNQASEDLTGFTLIKPYISDVQLPIKNLTCSASFGYMISNQKDTVWEDAKAWEADLGVAYKISDNVVYSIDAGYAKISDLKTWTVAVPAGTYGATQPNLYLPALEDISNPDPIFVVQHKVEFTF